MALTLVPAGGASAPSARHLPMGAAQGNPALAAMITKVALTPLV